MTDYITRAADTIVARSADEARGIGELGRLRGEIGVLAFSLKTLRHLDVINDDEYAEHEQLLTIAKGAVEIGIDRACKVVAGIVAQHAPDLGLIPARNAAAAERLVRDCIDAQDMHLMDIVVDDEIIGSVSGRDCEYLIDEVIGGSSYVSAARQRWHFDRVIAVRNSKFGMPGLAFMMDDETIVEFRPHP